VDGIPEAVTSILSKLTSQCGLSTGFAVLVAVWFAWQLAKTREAWEKERIVMLKAQEARDTAYNNLAVATAKLEGMLSIAQQHRR
jgi:hypothetical protein